MRRAPRTWSSLILLPLLGWGGCGVEPGREAARMPTSRSVESPTPLIAGQPASAVRGARYSADATPPAKVQRKIIYTATVELVVEDFSGVPDAVAALVKKHDGYVADSRLTGSVGVNRRGKWRIRVPVARFDEVVSAVKSLGELVEASTESQDVSEEYYDVDARVRNKTKEEERLLKLLEDRPGKLEDVIAIERELSRVREELERMQGRLRVLADQTAMTTVELSISEVRDYQPPEAATFQTRIRRAFDGSISGLRWSGEEIVVSLAALLPWLPVAAMPAVVIALLVRRRRRRRRSGTGPAAG